MSYSISISEAAERDLLKAFVWYERQQTHLGQRFKNRISQSIDYIQKHPMKTQIRYDEVRVFFLDVFPYGIHYRVKQNDILIISVFHTAQNPEQWENR